MKDEAGGRLKSFQPHLPWQQRHFSLNSAGIESPGPGLPRLGEGAPGEPRGPEAGTSAILAGERTTLHRVPSLPPARGPGIPLLTTWAFGAQGLGALWGIGVTLEVHQSLGARKGKGEGERERVRREGVPPVLGKATFRC